VLHILRSQEGEEAAASIRCGDVDRGYVDEVLSYEVRWLA
jgi:hypothetical protein